MRHQTNGSGAIGGNQQHVNVIRIGVGEVHERQANVVHHAFKTLHVNRRRVRARFTFDRQSQRDANRFLIGEDQALLHGDLEADGRLLRVVVSDRHVDIGNARLDAGRLQTQREGVDAGDRIHHWAAVEDVSRRNQCGIVRGDVDLGVRIFVKLRRPSREGERAHQRRGRNSLIRNRGNHRRQIHALDVQVEGLARGVAQVVGSRNRDRGRPVVIWSVGDRERAGSTGF